MYEHRFVLYALFTRIIKVESQDAMAVMPTNDLFKHVFTGKQKTVKRAITRSDISKLQHLSMKNTDGRGCVNKNRKCKWVQFGSVPLREDCSTPKGGPQYT